MFLLQQKPCNSKLELKWMIQGQVNMIVVNIYDSYGRLIAFQ